MNTVALVGRLVRDPEMITFNNAKQKTTITIAVPRMFKTTDKDTDFFQVEAWEKTANLIAEKFKKGSRIGIVARAQQEEWTNKETGKKQSKVVFVADSVTFIDAKNNAVADGQRAQAVNDTVDSMFNSEDEIPF